jgi:ribonucleoside-diphosphate reductase alpha chain
MQVIKRNGKSENFNFNKIEKVIKFACESQEQVEQFKSMFELNVKNNMTTKGLQVALIQTSVGLTTMEETYWDKATTKLYAYDLYKEAGINRGYKSFGYGSLYELLKMGSEMKADSKIYDELVMATLTEMGLTIPEEKLKSLYDLALLDTYTKAEIKELGAYIKPERDYIMSYAGIKTLADRYCVQGYAGEVLELPQEAFMNASMKIATAEKPEDRVEYAKKFYDVLSLLNGTLATPSMSNMRKPKAQGSSCFIGTTDDSLESIYNLLESFAMVSKHGGGFGLYIGKTRAKNSSIDGHANVSGGVVPWIRNFNDTAIAVDQLGVRKGAISITLDVWHLDIFDFLSLKTNNGDERRKAHDIFPSVSIPDLFFKQLKSKGDWFLFDPHEIRQFMGYSIEDSWGEDFEAKYWQCVKHPLLRRQQVKPIDIIKMIITSATETGTPFLFFRDTVNRDNPNKHEGIIYASNLCHEICQVTKANGEVKNRNYTDENGDTIIVSERKAGHFVVCNLTSLNLGRVHTPEMIEEVVPLFIRMMDNVITLNFYPTEEARVTNSEFRAVGLGTFGYHHMLALNAIDWESDEHLEFADTVYEKIFYEAVKASMELSIERGHYKYFEGSEWHTGEYFKRNEYTTGNKEGKYVSTEQWIKLADDVAFFGLRNANLLAVAPNGSSSLYGGSTQSIDAIMDIFYLDEKKNQITPIVAPDLSPATFPFYSQKAHVVDRFFGVTTDRHFTIEANGVRQRHIDQAQSFNLYITPDTSAVQLLKMWIKAWETGSKTIYYTRSRSMDIDDCEACSA